MRRIGVPIFVGGIAALAATWHLASCASLACEDDGTCRGAATSDAGRDTAPADATPDEDVSNVVAGCEKAPSESSDVVVDRCGVFVAPTGDDAAAGTKTAPFRTIAKGIVGAKAQK